MWRMLDTFSGIGGFSLAAAWTRRIRTVGFIEIDPFCRRVLARHWPGVPIHDDIRTYVADAAGGYARHVERGSELHGGASRLGRDSSRDASLDLLTGGFPCQPFSAAGKRQGAADDRYLWPELHRLISSLRPRWCLLENVPGIVRMEGGLDRVLADLEASGYACGTVVVPAAAVGAQHRRDRVWIVAHALGQSCGQRRSSAGIGSQESLGEAASAHIQHGVESVGAGAIARDVADAPRRGVRRGQAPGPGGLAAQCGQDAADTDSDSGARLGHGARPAEWAAEGEDESGGASVPCGHGRHEALCRLGDAPHGLPGWVVGRPAFGPAWEDGIERVTAYEEDRVSKLKALGNAIVPQVAYELMLMMLAVDDAEEDEDDRR